MSPSGKQVESGYPTPAPSRDTAKFWEHAAKGELRAPRCTRCGRWIWQPRPVCPSCHSFELAWDELPTVGRVISWTVPRPPLLPALTADAPFAVLLIDVTDGVTMVGNLVDDVGNLAGDDHIGQLQIGAQVALRWHQRDDSVLPGWTTGIVPSPAPPPPSPPRGTTATGTDANGGSR